MGFEKEGAVAIAKVVRGGMRGGGKVVKILVKVLLALFAGWLRYRDNEEK